MATYAAYRHIELDKVGSGKKRVSNNNNSASEIHGVLRSASASNGLSPSNYRSRTSETFTRLFGHPDEADSPRKMNVSRSAEKQRNPVTGDGVQSWDVKKGKVRNRLERNPVTGEIQAAATAGGGQQQQLKPLQPVKMLSNGHANNNNADHINGNARLSP